MKGLHAKDAQPLRIISCCKKDFAWIDFNAHGREPYLALLMTVRAGHRPRQVAIYVLSTFYDLAWIDFRPEENRVAKACRA
jgi:hypothetical protein